MPGPGEIFWRLLPAVRATERPQALFFTGLLTLISAAQTMGLAGSEALLLAELGSERLPETFIAAALVTVLGCFVYASRVGRMRNDRLLIGMLAGAAIVLFAGAVATTRGVAWVLPALFCVFYLTQAVFLNHFWTFSGDYFDSLTSKRLFPVFVVGSSVGGLIGGIASFVLTGAVGAVSLVWGWGALLLASALLLRLARRALRRWGPLELEEADETSVEGIRGAARYVGASPLGRWLVASALGMVVAIFVAQYLYSTIFAAAFPGAGELAAFFALYLAVTNLVEIALELWLTPWLIRRFGVPTAHLLHPLLCLVSFGGLFIHFGVATGVGARVTRELFENAVAQPIRSLVFNALPQRLRGRIRAFLEGIVVYAGMFFAGALLVLVPSPDPRWLVAVGGGAALLYGIANLRVRAEYLDELVSGIREGRLDFGATGDEIGDLEASRLASLCEQLLLEERDRPSRSLLRLLPGLAARGVLAPLVAGASHPQAQVREICVRELFRLPADQRPDATLRQALSDADERVRLAAIGGLAETRADDAETLLAPLLSDGAPRVRAAAAAGLGASGLPVLRAMLAGADASAVSAALAVAPEVLAREIVAHFDHPDPTVRAEALRRAADVASPEALPAPPVLASLRDVDPDVRRAALGLVPIVAPERLEDAATALADPAPGVRRAAVATLSGQGERGAAAVSSKLRADRETTAEAALQVLADATPAPLRREALRRELRHHVRGLWLHLLAYPGLPPGDEAPSAFLRVAVTDTLLRHRRLAFRALALLENERIVQKVQAALRSGVRRTSADALEVLSHLGDRESVGLLVLAHEAGPIEDRSGAARAALGVSGSPGDPLQLSAGSESRWVRAAAAALGSGLRDHAAEVDVMERLLALKQVPLFANLSLDQLEAIHQLAREATFQPGEVVMRQGDPGSELYLLLEGRLDVYLDWETPEQSRLGEIRAVDYVGEMAILDDEPRSATIVAVEDSRLLSLEGEGLKDLILQMPEISFEIFRVLTARVRTAERRLQHR